MQEDKIKDAFVKAKQDIFYIQSQLDFLRHEISEIRRILDSQTDNRQTLRQINQAQTQENKTENPLPTHIPADNLPLKPLKTQNTEISTGNEGVSTDRQTDRQTDTSTGNEGVKVRFNEEIEKKTDKITELTKVKELINSLDDIKKDIRQKLKKLTNQEMLVFSTIYQLEQEGFIVDYTALSQKLKITESSIRDYIQRILKKGLPISKTKENNKKILLSIPQDLKKIASLSTITQLRDL